MHQIVSEMRLCESVLANSGLTLVLAQPDNSSPAPETVSASEVDDTMRPSQRIISDVGQPAEGWGPLFPEDAPHRGGQECKQQWSFFLFFPPVV